MIYKSVAIVGAGFSGSLLAINLLRHAGPQATLIERRPVFGRGVAYSAPHPSHLLNVRAGNMSALSDRPAHFAEWCTARGLGGGADFVQRKVYGEYLGDLLEHSAARAGDRLALVGDEAVSARVGDDGVVLGLASGRANSPSTHSLSPSATCRRTPRRGSIRRRCRATATPPIRGPRTSSTI